MTVAIRVECQVRQVDDQVMQSIESPINEYANEATNGDTSDWETATRLPVIGVVKKSAVCAADVATSFRFFSSKRAVFRRGIASMQIQFHSPYF